MYFWCHLSVDFRTSTEYSHCKTLLTLTFASYFCRRESWLNSTVQTCTIITASKLSKLKCFSKHFLALSWIKKQSETFFLNIFAFVSERELLYAKHLHFGGWNFFNIFSLIYFCKKFLELFWVMWSFILHSCIFRFFNERFLSRLKWISEF